MADDLVAAAGRATNGAPLDVTARPRRLFGFLAYPFVVRALELFLEDADHAERKRVAITALEFCPR